MPAPDARLQAITEMVSCYRASEQRCAPQVRSAQKGRETPLVAKLLAHGLEMWLVNASSGVLPVAACWPMKPRKATCAQAETFR